MKIMLKILLIYVVALSMTLAQTTNSSDAAENATMSERARLGNQRIQIEADRRAREEQQRLEQEEARLRAEEQAKLRAQQAISRSEMAAAQSSKPGATELTSNNDMSRILEQLRLLGELKDDGYVSDEEFRKIKQRILDDQL